LASVLVLAVEYKIGWIKDERLSGERLDSATVE
jgi:hypothetical protein